VILGLTFTDLPKCPIITKRLQRMKKYNEEYFSVIDKRTGRKILDCGDEMDALNMVAFDSQNRTYTRNKFLMGPVVDVEIPKALPTNEIVVNMNGGVGGSWKQIYEQFDNAFGVKKQKQLNQSDAEVFVP
jgi:hypothetical protein